LCFLRISTHAFSGLQFRRNAFDVDELKREYAKAGNPTTNRAIKGEVSSFIISP
jgi:hypothetical protein